MKKGNWWLMHSNDANKGVKELSDPIAGGLESLNKLPRMNLDVIENNVVNEDELLITVAVRNSLQTLFLFINC
jgi:hypothetical protein